MPEYTDKFADLDAINLLKELSLSINHLTLCDKNCPQSLQEISVATNELEQRIIELELIKEKTIIYFIEKKKSYLPQINNLSETVMLFNKVNQAEKELLEILPELN